MLKIFVVFILILALALLQVGLFPALPFFHSINILLLFMIYLSAADEPFYLYAAIFAGSLLDLYSSHIFGIYIFAMISAVIFNHYVYYNILTNRRFFSAIILTTADIVFFNLVEKTGAQTLSFLKIEPAAHIWQGRFGYGLMAEIAASIVCVALFYFARNYWRGKTGAISSVHYAEK
jgi:rod shape-determining protein MreD